MNSPDIRARLQAARGFLFDLDGTLVLGDRNNKNLDVLPGAVELLGLLESRQIPYAVLTNGTVRPPAAYTLRLRESGLRVPEQKMLTPSTVAADYFSARGIKTIFVLGVEGVWKPLRDAGLQVILPSDSDADPKTADAIFVGWCREIHMDDIEAACNAVWNGAGLYAASLVPFFAAKNGRALGSSRAISAMITSVTGRRATALGKPSQHALRSAARRLGCKPSELVVVGDDPELEVRMALRGKALAVAVQTGIAGAHDVAKLATKDQPQLSLTGVADLLKILQRIQ
jgi:NagD protein